MYAWLVFVLSVLCLGGMPTASSAQARSGSMFDVMGESLTGDVYAESAGWRELSLGSLFSEGWNEPWASPPAGEGGAPRQGWLNAYDGVFYRLGIATFNFADDFNQNGKQYAGGLTFYTPFNRRLELRTDIPSVVSNKGTGTNYEVSFGDLQFTPRLLLSETRNFTHSFNVTLRVPTGKVDNGTGVAAVTPDYEFWANVWRGLVLRGGVGVFVPYGGQSRNEVGARTTVLGNLAGGYYFTAHDRIPFGDLVGYVSANLSQLTEGPGSKTTTVTLTPGFRTHLGSDWYLLGGVEIPVTDPEPFNYQLLTGIMKVF
jgi:hypothetical protein